MTATEDAVLHVLDVQARGAELVEDLGEYADAVEVADRQGDRSQSSGIEVHALSCLSGHERVDDLRHARGDGALRLLRRGADVVGRDDVGVAAELRVPGTLAGRRF